MRFAVTLRLELEARDAQDAEEQASNAVHGFNGWVFMESIWKLQPKENT